MSITTRRPDRTRQTMRAIWRITIVMLAPPAPRRYGTLVRVLHRRPPRVPLGGLLVRVTDPQDQRLLERTAGELHRQRQAGRREPARQRQGRQAGEVERRHVAA